MIRVLSLLALTAMLAGCTLGKDTGEQDTTLIRDNEKTDSLFGPIVGTYEGYIRNTDHGDEEVRLYIFVSNEDAKNPDGTDATRRVAKGYLERNNPIIADYFFKLSYAAETGTLTLTNKSDSDEVQTVSAHIQNGHITGDIVRRRATLGQLDLNFVTHDTNSKDDQRDRLLRLYKSISGVYRGTLPGKKRGITITLSATTDGDLARLDGVYRDLDVPGGELDLALKVSYRPEKHPPQITMNGEGAGRRALNFEGTLIGDMMSVDVTSPKIGGSQGHSDLKRVGPANGMGNDELFKEYQAAAGTYRGALVAGGRSTAIEMDLRAEWNGTLPTLTGRIIFAGNRAEPIDVQTVYDPKNRTIEIYGYAKDLQAIDFEGSFDGASMNLNYSLENRPVGTANLHR